MSLVISMVITCQKVKKQYENLVGCLRTIWLLRVGGEISIFSMPKPVSVRYFKTSPEIIQLAVMLYVRFPLSLRNVEDLLHERGIDVSYESVRYWWHRFGSQFASQIKKRRAGGMQSSNWKWQLG